MTLDQMKARRISDSKLEARALIEKSYPVEIQLSMLAGFYDSRPGNDPKNPANMKPAIQKILNAQNSLEAQVNTMTDVDAIDQLKFADFII